MRRRERILLTWSISTVAGIAVLIFATWWLLWNQFLATEEEAIAGLAETLGRTTEQVIVDARDMLESLNADRVEPCSDEHLRALDRRAFAQPHILAIGYWEAAERRCGAGFAQAIQLKPPRADRIYDSGLIAWWPSAQTEAAGLELFLMRLGRYDVAIDPRVLLQATPARGRKVGLWVEGLRMASVPDEAVLPPPRTLASGLSVRQDQRRMVAHFAVDAVLPIEVVVTEPIRQAWARYWPTVTTAGIGVLLLSGAWSYTLWRTLRRRLGPASALSQALAEGGVSAQYQPIIDLRTGRCAGAEALVRWIDEDGEPVPAETLIAVAERAGLIPRVTLAVLDLILGDLGATLRERPELRVHLNLAPEDLAEPTFADELARRLHAAGVSPRSIELEITERALLDSEESRRIIHRLRRSGHRIAIDDFGTGYSSLAYLERFELDTLKIDRAFVEAIGTGAVTSHVVHHVVELGKGLGLEIIAEGVQSRQQAEWLHRRGVHLVQGFRYSHPLSGERFIRFHDAARSGPQGPGDADGEPGT